MVITDDIKLFNSFYHLSVAVVLNLVEIFFHSLKHSQGITEDLQGRRHHK